MPFLRFDRADDKGWQKLKGGREVAQRGKKIVLIEWGASFGTGVLPIAVAFCSVCFYLVWVQVIMICFSCTIRMQHWWVNPDINTPNHASDCKDKKQRQETGSSHNLPPPHGAVSCVSSISRIESLSDFFS
jgi:hypothetical protein